MSLVNVSTFPNIVVVESFSRVQMYGGLADMNKLVTWVCGNPQQAPLKFHRSGFNGFARALLGQVLNGIKINFSARLSSELVNGNTFGSKTRKRATNPIIPSTPNKHIGANCTSYHLSRKQETSWFEQQFCLVTSD